MSPRSQSALILLTTLFLGMVLGALLFSTVQRYRFRAAIELVRPSRLIAGIEDVVQPSDDAQRQAVHEVLTAAEDHLRQLREERRGSLRSFLDSLEASLAPHLRPGQLERLRQHLDERQRVVGPRKHPGQRPSRP